MTLLKYNLVILAGGSGERLWPLSKKDMPKQFVKMNGSKSLFQNTIIRFKHDKKFLNTITIVTRESFRLILLNQLKELFDNLDDISIILEPIPKNTAPSMCIGALVNKNKNELPMVVVPSDQIVQDNNRFLDIIHESLNIKSNELGMIAIKPAFPSSNYGYIEFTHGSGRNIATRFNEKPDLKLSEKLIKDGCYWNGGIFISYPSHWLSLFKKYDASSYALSVKSYEKCDSDEYFTRINETYFSKIQSNSIDYSVIEKMQLAQEKIIIYKLDTYWSDLGSWETFSDYYFNNKKSNKFFGNIYENIVTNSIIYSNKKAVIASKIDNMLIIDTEDSLYVADKNEANEIKEIINRVPHKDQKKINHYNKEHRIWGYFEILREEDEYKVKKLVLYPKMKISLQRHKFRSEHWVVVKGKATVIKNDEKFYLEKNQSTYIEKGHVHQLINNTNSLLEIIEVQIGTYLGEDDIERLIDK